MKLFGGNKLIGGTATRAEVYGLFVAAIVLIGGGGAYAYSESGGFDTTPALVSSATATPSASASETGDNEGTGDIEDGETGATNDDIDTGATNDDIDTEPVAPKIDCFALPQIPHSGTPIYGGTAQVLQGETYVPPAGYGAIKSGTTSGSNIPTYDNYTWGLELTNGLSGTGLQLHELGCKIAEAHGYWGNQYSLGLSLSGDTILHIYNSEVDLGILDQVLRSVGAR
jgi:hypothetical protein